MVVGGWHWNDAWIFAAVVIADRMERDRATSLALPAYGATLADVLFAANFLNNSLPMRAEIEAAVRRLGGAGLITVDDDVLEVATAGEHLWRMRSVSGLSAAVDSLRSVLNRASTPGTLAWSLDEATYAAAVREYGARAVDGR